MWGLFKTFDEKLELAAKKHSLMGKVTLHNLSTNYGRIFTLRPIAPTELNFQIPNHFVTEVRGLIKRHYGSDRTFSVGAPITLEEIHTHQGAWNAHCRDFWAAYD